jgi:hypothetical protein
MFPIRNAVLTRCLPVVTWWLILANCVIFFIQIGLPPAEFESSSSASHLFRRDTSNRLPTPEPVRQQNSVEYLPVPRQKDAVRRAA